MSNKGDVSWTPIYLVIVVVIAVILLLAIIKPMFQTGAEYAESQLPSLILPLIP